jgi:hypothetical protein
MTLPRYKLAFGELSERIRQHHHDHPHLSFRELARIFECTPQGAKNACTSQLRRFRFTCTGCMVAVVVTVQRLLTPGPRPPRDSWLGSREVRCPCCAELMRSQPFAKQLPLAGVPRRAEP